MDSTPDKQLLDQVLHGSPEALAKLLEQFRPYLLLLADRHLDEGLRAKGGASDLVQDTCLAACEDLASFRGHNLRQLQAWLSRILLDRLAQFTRRYRDTKKRSVRFEASLERLLHCPRLDPHLIDSHPTPRQSALQHEELQALHQAFQQLPELTRQILQLHLQEQLSFEEIGQRLHQTADAVRMHWARALLKLNQRMRMRLGNES